MSLCKVLVVGGGGGAAGYRAGGGGGGGVVYDAAYDLVADNHSVTVGAGGVSATALDSNNTNGENSIFGSLTALGGGRGGGGGSDPAGGNGGCGGGRAAPGGSSTTPVAGGTGSQGGNGGSGVAAPRRLSGGGGGAGGNGEDAETTSGGGIGSAGDGGPGISNSITGSAVYYAGGGGGSISTTPGVTGVGGIGGGGDACGAGGTDCTGTSGTANTGGGGGGGLSTGSFTGSGGAGGSGVVIVAYPTADFTHTGGDVTGTDGSYTWVQFNSNGTLTLFDKTLLTDLVSYWKMDESSGNALDSHGSNPLTDNNAVDTYTGKINSGRFFNSTFSNFFSSSSSAFQTGNIDYTFQLWVRLESETTTRTLLSKSTSASSGGNEYTLFYDTDNGFSFQVSDSGTSSTVVNSSVEGTSGFWFCIHAWQDSVNGEIGISVNAGTPVTEALTVTPYAGSNPFFIGKNYTTGANYLWGTVDEVGFWKNRVLSADDRTELYNSGAALAYPFGVGGEPPAPDILDIVTVSDGGQELHIRHLPRVHG